MGSALAGTLERMREHYAAHMLDDADAMNGQDDNAQEQDVARTASTLQRLLVRGISSRKERPPQSKSGRSFGSSAAGSQASRAPQSFRAPGSSAHSGSSDAGALSFEDETFTDASSEVIEAYVLRDAKASLSGASHERGGLDRPLSSSGSAASATSDGTHDATQPHATSKSGARGVGAAQGTKVQELDEVCAAAADGCQETGVQQLDEAAGRIEEDLKDLNQRARTISRESAPSAPRSIADEYAGSGSSSASGSAQQVAQPMQAKGGSKASRDGQAAALSSAGAAGLGAAGASGKQNGASLTGGAVPATRYRKQSDGGASQGKGTPAAESPQQPSRQPSKRVSNLTTPTASSAAKSNLSAPTASSAAKVTRSSSAKPAQRKVGMSATAPAAGRREPAQQKAGMSATAPAAGRREPMISRSITGSLRSRSLTARTVSTAAPATPAAKAARPDNGAKSDYRTEYSSPYGQESIRRLASRQASREPLRSASMPRDEPLNAPRVQLPDGSAAGVGAPSLQDSPSLSTSEPDHLPRSLKQMINESLKRLERKSDADAAPAALHSSKPAYSASGAHGTAAAGAAAPPNAAAIAAELPSVQFASTARGAVPDAEASDNGEYDEAVPSAAAYLESSAEGSDGGSSLSGGSYAGLATVNMSPPSGMPWLHADDSEDDSEPAAPEAAWAPEMTAAPLAVHTLPTLSEEVPFSDARVDSSLGDQIGGSVRSSVRASLRESDRSHGTASVDLSMDSDLSISNGSDASRAVSSRAHSDRAGIMSDADGQSDGGADEPEGREYNPMYGRTRRISQELTVTQQRVVDSNPMYTAGEEDTGPRDSEYTQGSGNGSAPEMRGPAASVMLKKFPGSGGSQEGEGHGYEDGLEAPMAEPMFDSRRTLVAELSESQARMYTAQPPPPPHAVMRSLLLAQIAEQESAEDLAARWSGSVIGSVAGSQSGAQTDSGGGGMPDLDKECLQEITRNRVKVMKALTKLQVAMTQQRQAQAAESLCHSNGRRAKGRSARGPGSLAASSSGLRTSESASESDMSSLGTDGSLADVPERKRRQVTLDRINNILHEEVPGIKAVLVSPLVAVNCVSLAAPAHLVPKLLQKGSNAGGHADSNAGGHADAESPRIMAHTGDSVDGVQGADYVAIEPLLTAAHEYLRASGAAVAGAEDAPGLALALHAITGNEDNSQDGSSCDAVLQSDAALEMRLAAAHTAVTRDNKGERWSVGAAAAAYVPYTDIMGAVLDLDFLLAELRERSKRAAGSSGHGLQALTAGGESRGDEGTVPGSSRGVAGDAPRVQREMVKEESLSGCSQLVPITSAPKATSPRATHGADATRAVGAAGQRHAGSETERYQAAQQRNDAPVLAPSTSNRPSWTHQAAGAQAGVVAATPDCWDVWSTCEEDSVAGAALSTGQWSASSQRMDSSSRQASGYPNRCVLLRPVPKFSLHCH